MALVRRPASRPPFNGNATKREVGDALRNLFSGRVDWVGEFTLSASASTTMVSDLRVGQNSVVTLEPTTANAAAERAAGTMYVGTYADGSFTITHANNAQNDRTFRYVVVS